MRRIEITLTNLNIAKMTQLRVMVSVKSGNMHNLLNKMVQDHLKMWRNYISNCSESIMIPSASAHKLTLEKQHPPNSQTAISSTT
jgi:hypothetical protein